MRKIYIHIGCGKTGSSALQVWLNQNADILFKKGVTYPIYDSLGDDDYKITSGNGLTAVNEIRSGRALQYFTDMLSSTSGNVLLSSENFQLLNESELHEISLVFLKLKVEPVVVVYLRNLYDILNSMYHQFVKRHLLCTPFDEFVYSLSSIQQFDVLNLWSSSFKKINVIHYDSEKKELEQSFLKAVNVEPNGVPKMKKKKVNRSLTSVEIEILRTLNRLFIEKYGQGEYDGFSAKFSNAFIHKRPEEKTYISYDEKIKIYLAEKFGENISKINNNYFNGENVLRVFNREEEYLSSEQYLLPDAFLEAIEVLMGMIKSFDIDGKISEPIQKPLEINDSRIVDALRNEAIKREAYDLKSSLELMVAAKVLRPLGPVINQKIFEYMDKLGSN